MFNYIDQLSILDTPENIVSLIMKIDDSDRPVVSWLRNASGSTILRCFRNDGSSWVFNDLMLNVAQDLNHFDFVEAPNFLHFVHTNLEESGVNVEVRHSRYSISDNEFNLTQIVDSGDIDFAIPIVHNGLVYFVLRKDGSLIAENEVGAVDFTKLSQLNFASTTTKIRAAYSKRHFFIVWSEEDATDAVIKSAMYNLITNKWLPTQTIATVDKTRYEIVCTKNKIGDSPSPDPQYKPFYCAISYRESKTINYLFIEHGLSGGDTSTTIFSKSYAGEVQDFTAIPKLSMSVAGQKAIVASVAEEFYILKSTDIDIGFTQITSPGHKVSNDMSSFVPVIDGDTIHYAYESDNIVYANAPFQYSTTRAERSFFTSDGSSAYLKKTKIPGLELYSIEDIIFDKNFDPPFVWVTKTGTNTVFLYDTNKKTFLTDFDFSVTKLPTFLTFDKKLHRILYLIDDTLHYYDIEDQSTESFTTFNLIAMDGPKHISIGGKEIFISDSNNDRVIAIDRSTLGFLRSISNNSMIKPYFTQIISSGGIIVKCIDNISVSTIYEFNKIGDLLASYPSYTVTPDDEPWYFSAFSTASDQFATTFDGSSSLLCIDTSDHSFWVTTFSGYTIKGIDIDHDTGQIFVSAINTSSENVILEVEGLTGQLVREVPQTVSGFVRILDKSTKSIDVVSNLVDAEHSVSGAMTSTFTSVEIGGTPVKIPDHTITVSSDTTSYEHPKQNDKHVYDKIAKADIWHFRHTGLQGAKISVNPFLTFDYDDTGTVRRVPVFSWAYDEEDYVDTYFISDGNEIQKMAIWYNDDGPNTDFVKVVTENNTVTSIFTYDGKLAVSAGGYLSIYSYDTMNRITSCYFSEDVIVYDHKFDKLYAGSKSRGIIWEIDPDLISSYVEHDAEDAISGITWSDHYKKYIVQCDNSIKLFDKDTGTIETIFDTNDYLIKSVSIFGEDISIGLKSYELIPVNGDFDTDDDFNAAVANRKTDRAVVLRKDSVKYIFSKDFDYDFVINSVGFDGSILSSFGRDKSNIYIKTYDVKTSAEISLSYETDSQPVDTIYLPIAERFISVLDDSSIVDWSADDLIILGTDETDNTGKTFTVVSNGLLIKLDDVEEYTPPFSSYKSVYTITTAITANTAISLEDFDNSNDLDFGSSGGNWADDFNIYLNGLYLTNGESAAANNDVYYLSSSTMAFEFDLNIGDVIQVEDADPSPSEEA